MKIYKQETNKSCGVACLRSIFNYYGNNYSEEDIWKKHTLFNTRDGGILNPIISLGVAALNFGYDVTYIGYNPRISKNNSSTSLLHSLKERSKTYFDFGKYSADEAINFLELGGKIKIDKLNIEKIKKIIKKNKFALVEIRPAFLNNKGNVNQNHIIILIGYNNKGFKVLDPHDAKEKIIPFDTFLISFYAAIPELLIIKKK